MQHPRPRRAHLAGAEGGSSPAGPPRHMSHTSGSLTPNLGKELGCSSELCS